MSQLLPNKEKSGNVRFFFLNFLKPYIVYLYEKTTLTAMHFITRISISLLYTFDLKVGSFWKLLILISVTPEAAEDLFLFKKTKNIEDILNANSILSVKNNWFIYLSWYMAEVLICVHHFSWSIQISYIYPDIYK